MVTDFSNTLNRIYDTDIGTYRVADVEQVKKEQVLHIETLVGNRLWMPFEKISLNIWQKFLRDHSAEESVYIHPKDIHPDEFWANYGSLK